MPDYRKLYHKAFHSITDAEQLIEKAANLLRTTQQQCEEMIIESDDTPIELLNKD